MIFLLLNPRWVSSFSHLLIYLKTGAVSANVEKIRIRYLDLSRLLAVSPKNMKVLEFGSGSSTIYFLSQTKISKLISVEENEKYLIHMKDSRLISHVSPVILEDEPLPGTRYRDSDKFLEDADLIYVDGPTSKVSSNGLALPNLDLTPQNDLTKKIVAVDCRTNTVIYIFSMLSKTHTFIPSKSFLLELKAIKLDPADFGSHYFRPEYKSLPGSMVRTSLFLPNII